MRIPFALAFAALLLAGCANPWNTMNVPVGASRDAVIARAGQPARVLPLPGGGQRLQYTLQPQGQYAFNVDLDATGHVTRSQQVLTEANLGRIQPGWSRDDVLREFGPPARIDRVASFQGDVMTYRWYGGDGNDMFYYVYVDPRGVVQRAHPGMEFHNAPADVRS